MGERASAVGDPAGVTGALATCYRDRVVLVTGHTGFKGSWLTTWLKALGARVIGLALAPEGDQSSLFEAVDVAQGMVSTVGDIRDRAALTALFRRHRPEIVFHLAAQALVRRSYDDPVLTYATNVMGTVHLLEAVRESPSVRAVVNVTSDKCYENREWMWGYRENEALGGRDPYSSSKACAELVGAAYRSAFFRDPGGPHLASARAGNVIGGGDWSQDRLVPDIVRALGAGQSIVLRHPEAIRPWQHVLEPLRGYLLLGQRLCTDGAPFAEAWNFGPPDDETVPVRDLVNRLLGAWGETGTHVEERAEGPGEAHALRLDSSKARARLGWRPLLPLDEALVWTVEWYRGYLADGATAGGILRRQLQEYAARMPA